MNTLEDILWESNSGMLVSSNTLFPGNQSNVNPYLLSMNGTEKGSLERHGHQRGKSGDWPRKSA